MTERNETATGRGSHRGGSALLSIRGLVDGGRSETVRLACPLCGRRFTVGRTRGPDKEIHYPGGKGRRTTPCRLVVTPDPLAGDFDLVHHIERVDDDIRVEDVVELRRREWEAEHGIGSYIRARLAGR